MLNIFMGTCWQFLCLLQKKVYSGPLPILKIRLLSIFSLLFFLLLSSMNSLYILNTNPLSDLQFASILPYSVGFLLILLIVSFPVQKL